MVVTKQEREMYWRGVLEQQAGSGLSVRSWCAREAMGYATFMYWRRRLGRPAVGARLTLMRVTEGGVVDSSVWLSVGGVRIEVKPGFDAGLLRQVVAALAA
ncbi:MAG: hypothetical protein FIB08_17865 [Candidatus Methanoperedens sp.]|nr:hypothetical protein [Candidatus Methanoperedens sp.]